MTGKGKPVRAGTPVQVIAWPDSQKLAKLKEGQSVKLAEVSSVKTDSSGKFSLAPALRAAAKRSTPLNVMIVANDGQTPYQYSTVLSGTDVATSNSTLLSQAGSAANVSLSKDAFVMKPASDVQKSDLANGVATQAAVATPASYSCSTRLEKKVGTSYAQVGATFLYTTGASAKFQFRKGTNSSLGVASSSSGKKGSFSAGGTTSVTSDVTLDFPTKKSGIWFYKAQVESGKFSTVCQNLSGPGIRQSYQVRPIDFTGGMRMVKGTGFSENHKCVKFLKNSTFTKDKTRAVTWNRGLTLPSIAGISVSSQSGFTTSTRVIYKSGSKNRQLCGHKDWPAKNAGSIKLK